MIFICYCILVYRRWKHASFFNSKQNYGPLYIGCFTKIEKAPRFLYYIQTRTFIKMFIPQNGTNNKKYYKEKKLIG